MKLIPDSDVAEVSTDGENTQFTIQANAKAFVILSDGLYSNKIKAVVRELSTNAYDAHIESGCPEKPFDVQLPSILDAHFCIRDYGPGLSHDDCMNLYVTYFASTKNNSNKAVGCMGLGSKSPFAYTDVFHVISYHNGMKRTYTAFKNQNGPELILQDECESNEPSGLCVKFKVERCDVDEFEDEAREVYRYFKTKPNMAGRKIEFLDKIPTMTGDGWEAYDYEENVAIMGQVAYPIDVSQLKDCNVVYDFLNEIDGLHIYVDIGDVDITPDRERLSYNDTTKKNLGKSIIKIIESVEKEIQNKLDDCTSLYDARKAFVQSKGFMKFYSQNLQWKGQDLFELTNKQNILIEVDDWEDYKYYKKVPCKVKPNNERFGGEIIFDDNTLFFYNDLKKGGISRLNYHLKQNCGVGTTKVYVFCGKNLDDFLKVLGNAKKSDIICLSELPKPVYNKSGISGGIPCLMYDPSKESFVETKISVKYDNAIWLVESYGLITVSKGNYRKWNRAQVSDLLNGLVNMGHDFDGTFYTVKPSMVKSKDLHKRKNWSCGIERITKAVKETVDQKKSSYSLVKHDFNWNNYRKLKSIFDTIKNEDMEYLLKEYAQHKENILNAEKDIEDFKKIRHYTDGLGANIEYEAPKFSEEYFENKTKRLLKRYSFLYKFRDTEINQAIKYIKDMDELHEFRQSQFTTV